MEHNALPGSILLFTMEWWWCETWGKSIGGVYRLSTQHPGWRKPPTSADTEEMDSGIDIAALAPEF